MVRVKSYNSEVKIICDGKTFMIPLRFLTRQSKKISEVAYAPMVEITFSGYPVSTIKNVVHFCRHGYVHVKGEEKENLLKFAKQWDMIKLTQFLTKSNQNTTNQQQNQQNQKPATDSRTSTGPGPSKTNSGFFGSVQRKDSASSTSTVNSQTSVPKQRREFVNSKYPSNSSIASWSSNQSVTNYTNFYGKNENNTSGKVVEQKNEKKNESGRNSYANSDAESTKSGSSTTNFAKKPLNVQNSVKNNANQQVPKPVIPSKTISTGSNPGNSSIQMKVVNNQSSSKMNKSPPVPTVKQQTTVIHPVVSPVKSGKVEPYLVITPNNASSGPKSNVTKIPSAPVDPYLVITSNNTKPEPKRVVPVIPPPPVDPKPAPSRPALTTPTKTQNQTPKRPPTPVSAPRITPQIASSSNPTAKPLIQPVQRNPYPEWWEKQRNDLSGQNQSSSSRPVLPTTILTAPNHPWWENPQSSQTPTTNNTVQSSYNFLRPQLVANQLNQANSLNSSLSSRSTSSLSPSKSSSSSKKSGCSIC